MVLREPSRRHLWFWWLVLIVIIVLSSLLISRFPRLKNKIEVSQPGLYPVAHFVDGDTIAVSMNGTTETVRMIGVDTPETHRPNTPVQCYGPQAADYTRTLIGSNSVRLQADPLDTNRDRYGRLLRYVYLPDGSLVEDKLISNGYGFAYTLFPFEKKEQFVSQMNIAQNAHKGLWSDCQVHQVPTGAYQTNPAS